MNYDTEILDLRDNFMPRENNISVEPFVDQQ